MSSTDWKTFGLDQCYWFQEGPGVRKWQFTSSGIKLLNVANIEKTGRLNLAKSERHLSVDEVEKRYSHFLIDAGDLVIASSGISFDDDGLLRTRGVFVEPEHLPLCLNTSTIRFKAKADVSSLNYLKHWLDSRDFRQQITKLVTGSAQQNFGPSHLKALKISLPSLTEQHRIAAILDKADALRAKRREALAQLDELTQSIFIEMFGDPVTNSQGWDVRRLDEVTDVGSSKRVFVEELVSSGIPFFRGTEVGQLGDGQSVEPSLFITNEHYERLKAEAGIPIKGDLLLPSICPDGRIYMVQDDEPFYFKDGRVLWISVKRALINSVFLRQQLKQLFISNYSKIASGTTFAELKIFALKNLSIFLPPLYHQEQFANIVGVLQTQTDSYKTQQVELDSFFTTLQHRAFRGEL